MQARGQDVVITINRDGQPEVSLSDIRDATWDPGLAEDIDNYLGADSPDVQGINNETSLELTAVPRSSDWLRVVEYQRLKNAGDPTYLNVTIDVSFRTDWSLDGGVGRIIMRRCTLVGGGLSFSARTDKVTTNPRFVAGKWRRLDSI
jgi:hypothetical protein